MNKIKYVNKIDSAKAKCKIDKYTIYLELGSYYEFYLALLYQLYKNRYSNTCDTSLTIKGNQLRIEDGNGIEKKLFLTFSS